MSTISKFKKGQVLTAAQLNAVGDEVNQSRNDINVLQANTVNYATKTELSAITAGTFYGYAATSSGLPTGGSSDGYAYVGTAAPYAIYNYNHTNDSWTDSGATLSNPVIAATQDPSSNLIQLTADGSLVTGNIATPEFIDDRLADIETYLGDIDDVPTAGSDNLVQSDGVKNALIKGLSTDNFRGYLEGTLDKIEGTSNATPWMHYVMEVGYTYIIKRVFDNASCSVTIQRKDENDNVITANISSNPTTFITPSSKIKEIRFTIYGYQGDFSKMLWSVEQSDVRSDIGAIKEEVIEIKEDVANVKEDAINNRAKDLSKNNFNSCYDGILKKMEDSYTTTGEIPYSMTKGETYYLKHSYDADSCDVTITLHYDEDDTTTVINVSSDPNKTIKPNKNVDYIKITIYNFVGSFTTLYWNIESENYKDKLNKVYNLNGNLCSKIEYSSKRIDTNGEIVNFGNSTYKVSELIDVSSISAIVCDLTFTVPEGFIIAAYDTNLNIVLADSIKCNSYSSKFTGVWRKTSLDTKYIRIAFVDSDSNFNYKSYAYVGDSLSMPNIKDVNNLNPKKSAYESLIDEFEEINYSINEEALYPPTHDYVIEISTQSEFDDITSNIDSALTNHDSVLVHIKSGTYKFSENHLSILNKDYSDKTVTILGDDNVVITADGNDYVKANSAITFGKSSYPYIGSFNINNGYTDYKEDVPISTSGNIVLDKIQTAETGVELVDEETELYRVKTEISFPLSSLDLTNVWIKITDVYRSYNHKVNRIENGYIYFTKTAGSNFNTEESRGIKTRYLLLNIVEGGGICVYDGKIFVPCKYETIHEATKVNFLNIDNSTLKTLFIKNLKFISNRGGKEGSLLYIKDTTIQSNVSICDCEFIGIKSQLMYVDNTSNILIWNNKFSHIYRYGLVLRNGSNIAVYNNVFDTTGLDLDQTWCIQNSSANTYIGHNTFKDFVYSAVSTGHHYTNVLNVASAIIEFNDLYYSPEFLNTYYANTMADVGAIYTGTKNFPAIIRYNKIIGIKAHTADSCIYCDDGAKNVKIYGNLLIGSYMAISLRRVHNQAVDEAVPDCNENNFIGYNFIPFDSVLFGGKENVDTNIYAQNFALFISGHTKNSRITDVVYEGDCYISNFELIERQLKLWDTNDLYRINIYRKLQKAFLMR